MSKKLTRNTNDKVVAGVASGLADYFQLEVTWVRIAFGFAAIFGGTGLWIYLILWIAIPENKIAIFSYKDDKEPTIDVPKLEKEPASFNGSLVGGTILVALGSYFLLNEFDLIPWWFSISKLWPVFIVGIGLYVIFKSARKESVVVEEQKENATTKKSDYTDFTEVNDTFPNDKSENN